MNPNGISVVIPAYNEENFLPATLKAVHEAQLHFREHVSPALPSEVVVVNNMSSDKTSEVATKLGARVVDHGIRNISAVRNAGIKAALYSTIIMIDADSFLQVDALTEVHKVMSQGRTVGGGFNVVLLTEKPVIRFAAAVFQSLVRGISGMSGAMFFFDRDSALAMGGFREDRLVAEDSTFAMGLRAYGKSHGGRTFNHLNHVKVGTLDRKDTDFLTIAGWLSQALMAFLGRKQRIEDLGYWYDPKR
jgi:glycosyltransferase involved in cell wall biosynthesis